MKRYQFRVFLCFMKAVIDLLTTNSDQGEYPAVQQFWKEATNYKENE